MDLDPDADPDPAIFISDLQDVNKDFFSQSFFAYYFLKLHLRIFSKIKSLITINILLFLKVRDFRILCGKIS